MERRDRPYLILFMLPAAALFAAFFLLPMARLLAVGGSGPGGVATYAAIVTEPRYFRSLASTSPSACRIWRRGRKCARS